MSAMLCIKVLKLDLLAPEVLRKAAKLAAAIFVTFFVIEGVCSCLVIVSFTRSFKKLTAFDALADYVGV